MYKFDKEVLNKELDKRAWNYAILAEYMQEHASNIGKETVKSWSVGKSEPLGKMVIALTKVLGLEYEDFYKVLSEEEEEAILKERRKGKKSVSEKSKERVYQLENEINKLARAVRELEEERENHE